MTRKMAKYMTRPTSRQCVVIAAYDAGLRHSEGYVARSLLARLDRDLRVILITRRNNVAELRASPEFKAAFPNVHFVGYDLPRWASWWKKGQRGYGLYSYLWQTTWPVVLKSKRRLVDRLTVVHTLNFHNDSIPSMGWILGKPSVWGPINHNERIRNWRLRNWPLKLKLRNALKSAFRGLAWRFDPLLALSTRKTNVVYSAGSWVDDRLRLHGRANVRRKSQLGLDITELSARRTSATSGLRLVSGGRLDWIKGIDLALEALAQLTEATLTLIGDGPCKAFLVDRAKELGISERVTFISAVSRQELMRHYVDHDIFLFPSAEAGGLAWVEALAIGLPVVGFEGPTELSDMANSLPGISLAQDTGTFSQNVKALAEAIAETRSRDNDPEKISLAARHHYGWGVFADEIQSAYRAAVEARG
jgi:glycosyltransferase involved in cell wall biosynthesis